MPRRARLRPLTKREAGELADARACLASGVPLAKSPDYIQVLMIREAVAGVVPGVVTPIAQTAVRCVA